MPSPCIKRCYGLARSGSHPNRNQYYLLGLVLTKKLSDSVQSGVHISRFDFRFSIFLVLEESIFFILKIIEFFYKTQLKFYFLGLKIHKWSSFMQMDVIGPRKDK